MGAPEGRGQGRGCEGYSREKERGERTGPERRMTVVGSGGGSRGRVKKRAGGTSTRCNSAKPPTNPNISISSQDAVSRRQLSFSLVLPPSLPPLLQSRHFSFPCLSLTCVPFHPSLSSPLFLFWVFSSITMHAACSLSDVADMTELAAMAQKSPARAFAGEIEYELL